MTGRSVKEWIGATPDTAIPPRVRLRVFETAGGRCAECGRKIMPGERWDCDHIVALANGGENRERNLRVLCCNCHKVKTAEDMAEKKIIRRKREKFLGIHPKRKSRPMPGSRASGIRKRMNGTIERW